MSKPTRTKSTKMYVDPDGQAIPAKYVKSYDRQRDATAQAILKDWLKAQQVLANVKERTVARITALQEAARKDSGVKDLGGAKGNIQFRSFDGNIVVRYDADARTEFDERLALAQQLINEAVHELAAGAKDADLVEIATRAFQPRRSGRLDMQRVRDLCSYNVSHPKWKQAVDIIKKCERQVGTRNYIRVAVREDADKRPAFIALNIAEI